MYIQKIKQKNNNGLKRKFRSKRNCSFNLVYFSQFVVVVDVDIFIFGFAVKPSKRL
jgi:hypothetical protein